MKIYNVEVLDSCPICKGQEVQVRYVGVEVDQDGTPLRSVWRCEDCAGEISGNLFDCEPMILHKATMPGAIHDVRRIMMASIIKGVRLEITHPECYYDLVVSVGDRPVYLAKVRSRKYHSHWDYEMTGPQRTRARHHMVQVACCGPVGDWHYLKVCRLSQFKQMIQEMSTYGSFGLTHLSELALGRGWPESIVREELL